MKIDDTGNMNFSKDKRPLITLSFVIYLLYTEFHLKKFKKIKCGQKLFIQKKSYLYKRAPRQ